MSSQLPDGPKKKEKNEPFSDIMKSMNTFFQEKPVKGFLQSIDDFFKTPFPQSAFSVRVSETDKEHHITAELPGIKREQIHIDVLDNYITISVSHAETLLQEDDKHRTFSRKQTMQQSSRTIPLPQPINEKKVRASYQDGLLIIRIPKQSGKKIIIDENN
ncbi:Hsp20/alpha crystallin family protein [Bacillus infantis]|uniref:Hsp20/alpha crystallin family protein n=1 Tax=Bacillus infantis TaxID=324767 RepID=UPI003CEB3352